MCLVLLTSDPWNQLQSCYCLVSMLTKMNFLSVESEGYDEWQAIFFFLNHRDLCVPLDALISSAYVCERKGNRNSFRKGDNLSKTKMSSRQMFLAEINWKLAPKNLHSCQQRGLHLFWLFFQTLILFKKKKIKQKLYKELVLCQVYSTLTCCTMKNRTWKHNSNKMSSQQPCCYSSV